VPVIVMAETRASVPGSTLTVAVDVIVPPADGVTLDGEKPTCTPPGKELALKSTAELNEPVEVTVTVSVEEPPAPTLSVGELRDSEKSAPEVTVSTKLVV
jgi:hypothetical protein